MIRPFLDNSAALFADLQPGVAAISDNAPQIADTLEIGTPVLRDSPQLNRQLAPTAQSLLDFNDNIVVRDGLTRLEQTTDILGPLARFVTPAQTVCNYGTLLFRNTASLFSKGADGGRWQRFTVFRPAERAQQRGQPRGGAGERRRRRSGTSSTTTRIRTRPRRARPSSARPATRTTSSARPVIGNVPGNQGTLTDAQPGGDTEEETP